MYADTHNDVPWYVLEYDVPIVAATGNQQAIIDSLHDKRTRLNLALGPPGTGKTYVAVECALAAYDAGLIDTIVLTIPLAPKGGRDLGFLKGSQEDKMSPWIASMIDVMRRRCIDDLTKSR